MRSLLKTAVVLLFSSFVSAATIHVPADQPTIQAAIDAAIDGDTVSVFPGTYQEPIHVTAKMIHIVSTGGPNVTHLVWQNWTNGYAISFQSVAGGTFEGFRVTSEVRSFGILFYNSYTVFRNNRFEGLLTQGNLATSSGTGVARFERNLFSNIDAGNAMLVFTDGYQVHAINNTIDNAFRAIAAYSSGSIVKNNILTRCSDWAVYNGGATITESYNCYWDNHANFLLNPNNPLNTYANPIFADQSSGNYTLDRTSPCLDAGDPNPDFNDPDGTRNDIGAYFLDQGPRVTEISLLDEDRLHVVGHTPTLAWHYYCIDSLPQMAYEIEIGLDSDWVVAEIWSPGVVASPDSFSNYLGIQLQDAVTYYGRMRVSNISGWGFWWPFSFHMNSLPSVPLQRSPIHDQVSGSLPELWIHNSTDAEGDTLTYDFAGSHDTDCVSGPAIELNNVPSGTDSAGGQITTPLAENCRYWWRVRAFDGYEYGDWSEYATFFVNGVQESPSAPVLLSPPDSVGLPVFNMRPVFHWEPSIDPDPLDTIGYLVELSLNSIFQGAVQYDSGILDSLEIPDSLEFATRYWWRVKATDRTGLWRQSVPSKSFWTWALGDLNHDHTCDIADLSRMVDFLFFGAQIEPLYIGDLNGSCNVDISDLTRIIDYLFFDGPGPKVGC